MEVVAHGYASVQTKVVVSRHLTSVTPNLSAWGFDTTFKGGLPGLGIGAKPASQLAQCHASTFRIALARMTNDFAFP
jgi:hypothetical protein